MNESDIVRLRHMLDAAREVMSFVEGETRESLDNDRKLMWALVKCVEMVGEAAAKVTPACREANPQIPWTAMIGMRNILVHVYFGINLNILWETATEQLPPLIAELEKIIPPESETD